MPATIELTQVVLGLEPYVLVRFALGDEGPDDLRAVISAGGGIGSVEEMRDALGLALANLPAPATEGEIVEDITAGQPTIDVTKESV